MHVVTIPLTSRRVLEKNLRKLSNRQMEKNIVVAKDIVDKFSRESIEISSVSLPFEIISFEVLIHTVNRQNEIVASNSWRILKIKRVLVEKNLKYEMYIVNIMNKNVHESAAMKGE